MSSRARDIVRKDDMSLEGLKVVEMGHSITAPYSSRLLAEFGAEVIKVEIPKCGDEARHCKPFLGDTPDLEKSGLFLCLNTGKLSITLDPSAVTGKKILYQILQQSDVFIENYPRQQMETWELDYAHLKEVNPNLAVISISPYGDYGPYKDYKGYGISACALGGWSQGNGEPGRDLLTAPFGIGHFLAGAMAALIALAVSIDVRQGGRGQFTDISEADCWIGLLTGSAIAGYVFSGLFKERTGRRVPGPYPRTTLPCKDGYFTMHAVQGYQWKGFLEIMGDGEIPEWYANDPRFKDRAEAGRKYSDVLDALLAPWMMSHTKKEIFELCRKKRIPFAPIMDISEVMAEPHFDDRNYFIDVGIPEIGKFKYPGAAIRMSRTSCMTGRQAPRLGEHNVGIYHQRLGYSYEELARLRAGGVI